MSSPASQVAGDAEIADSLTSKIEQLSLPKAEEPIVHDLPRYQYTELEPGRLRLFLLHSGAESSPIQGSLHAESLGNSEDLNYECLSYVYDEGGSPDSATILIDQDNFKVTKTLESALRQLRCDGETRSLWIESICVDQSLESTERDDQVHQLRDIFRGAKRLLIWLGKGDNHTGATFNEVEELAKVDEAEPAKGSEMLARINSIKDIRDALMSIGNHPYWQRGWTIHKISGSSNVAVLCGRRSIAWSTLVKAVDTINTIYLSSGFRDEDTSDLVESLGWIFRLGMLPDLDADGAKRVSILEHLHKYRHFQFANPLDRIHAIMVLPCVEDDSTFPIDYFLTKDDLFEKFTRWHITTTGTLDVLGYADPHDYNIYVHPEGRVLSPPKWVPDWRSRYLNPLATYAGASKSPVYNACGEQEANIVPIGRSPLPYYLSLPGIRIDRITEIGDVLEGDTSQVSSPTTPIMQQWESMMQGMSLENNRYSSKSFDTSPINYLAHPDVTSFLPGYPVDMNISNTATVGTFNLPQDVPPQKLALIEAYWRTLIADQVVFPNGDISMPRKNGVRSGRADRSFWRYWGTWHDGLKPEPGIAHDWKLEQAFPIQTLSACLHRKFMVTETGYMGLAPIHAKVGYVLSKCSSLISPIVWQAASTKARQGGMAGVAPGLLTLPDDGIHLA